MTKRINFSSEILVSKVNPGTPDEFMLAHNDIADFEEGTIVAVYKLVSINKHECEHSIVPIKPVKK